MAQQPAHTTSIEQLPEAARERIAQLKLLFIERSKGNLEQIRDLLGRRAREDDPRVINDELIKLAHSLVGASGLFGFPELGEMAFRLETLMRTPGYAEADFDRLSADLVDELARLG